MNESNPGKIKGIIKNVYTDLTDKNSLAKNSSYGESPKNNISNKPEKKNEKGIISQGDNLQLRVSFNDNVNVEKSNTSISTNRLFNNNPGQGKKIIGNGSIGKKKYQTNENMDSKIYFSGVLTRYKNRLNNMNSNNLKYDLYSQKDTGVEFDMKNLKGQYLKNLFKLLKPKLIEGSQIPLTNESNSSDNSLQNYLKIIITDELTKDFQLDSEDPNTCLILHILPYLFDNLKRRFKLKSIVYALFRSNYLEKELKPLISEKLLISCMLEAIPDIQTQIYLGTMLKMNDYPIPLAYWMLNNREKFEWKINFKLLYDILGNNKSPIYVNMGTSKMKHSGKTSLLAGLYDFQKEYLPINKEGNLPSPSVDVYPGLKGKRDFIMIDIHGFPTEQSIYKADPFQSFFKALFQLASVIILNVKPKDLEEIDNNNNELKAIIGFFQNKSKKLKSDDINFKETIIQNKGLNNLIMLIRDCDTEEAEYNWEVVESKLHEYSNDKKVQFHKFEVKNLKEIGEFFLKEEHSEIKKKIDSCVKSNFSMKVNINIFDFENLYTKILNTININNIYKYNNNEDDAGNYTLSQDNNDNNNNNNILEEDDEDDNGSNMFNTNDIDKDNDIIMKEEEEVVEEEKEKEMQDSCDIDIKLKELKDILQDISDNLEYENDYDPLPILSIMNKIYYLELEKNEFYTDIKYSLDARKINYIEDEIEILNDSIPNMLMKSKLLNLFISLSLSISYEEYIINIIKFERLIYEWKMPTYDKLKKERQDCLLALDREKEEEPKKILINKINDLTNKMEACNITIDKLWDEIMLTYQYLYNLNIITLEQNQIYDVLKKIFIQMLANGFPIHLARGCDIKISNIFLDQVIYEIDIKQNVYIVSVIGMQSSAKSTLLNYLFGSNFAVSAGRCTRGMYISLVKTIKNQHILIMDTEGLMSAERKDEIFDRQMALISFGSSNLVIINHHGDITRELKNLLQTVLYAMKHMKAIKTRPRILFVLRDQVDRTSKIQEEALLKIKTNLEEIGQEAGLDYKELIDIDFENLILLPSAFKEDMNNEIFSEEILKLRKKIIVDMENTKPSYIVKFRDFFNNIKNLWDAIVKYGKAILNFNTIGEILMKQEISQICDKLMKECNKPMIKEVEKAVDEYVETLGQLQDMKFSKDLIIPSHIFNIIEGKKKEVLQEFQDRTNNKFTAKLRNYYYEKLDFQFMNFDLLVRQLCEIRIQKLKERYFIIDLNDEVINNMELLLKEDKINEKTNEELLLKQKIDEKFKNYSLTQLKYHQDINSTEILDKVIEIYNFVISTKFYEDELFRETNYIEKPKMINYYNGNQIFNQEDWTLNSFIGQRESIANDNNNNNRNKKAQSIIKVSAAESKVLTSEINTRLKTEILDRVYGKVKEDVNYDIICDVCNLLTEFFNSEFMELNSRMINRLNMVNDISYMLVKQITFEVTKKRKEKRDEELKKLEEMKKQQIEEYLNLYKYRKDSKLTGENLAQRLFTDIKEKFSHEKTSLLKEEITKKIALKFPDQRTLMKMAYNLSFEMLNIDAIYKYCTNVNSWISEVFDMKYKEISSIYFKNLGSSLKDEFETIFKEIIQKMQRWRKTYKHDKFTLNDLSLILLQDREHLLQLIGANNEYDVNKFYIHFMKKFENLINSSNFHVTIYENIEYNINNMVADMKKNYIGCQARCPLCKNKCMEAIKVLNQPHNHHTTHLLKAFGGTGTVKSGDKKIPVLDYCISKDSYEKSYYHPNQIKENYTGKPQYKNLMNFIENVYPSWYHDFEENKKNLMKTDDEEFQLLKKIRLRRAWMKSKHKFLKLYDMKDEYPSKWKNLSYWEDSNTIIKFN